jgi:RHS repeat-associated protein
VNQVHVAKATRVDSLRVRLARILLICSSVVFGLRTSGVVGQDLLNVGGENVALRYLVTVEETQGFNGVTCSNFSVTQSGVTYRGTSCNMVWKPVLLVVDRSVSAGVLRVPLLTCTFVAMRRKSTSGFQLLSWARLPIGDGKYQSFIGSREGTFVQLTNGITQTLLVSGTSPPDSDLILAKEDVTIDCGSIPVHRFDSDTPFRLISGNDPARGLHVDQVPPCDPGVPGAACDQQKARDTDCSEQVADPVDVASGAYLYERTLLTLPNALPLNFELSYSTLLPIDRGSGFGWSHRFGMKLTVLVGNRIIINWPNGRVTQYLPGAGNSYVAQYGDAQDILVKNGDGSFDLTDQLLRKYRFAANGELQSETRTVQGVDMSLNYTWAAGRLQSVSDPVSAKQLNFGYDANGRMSSVSAIESGTTTATAGLAYDANGNLITLTDPLGKTMQFTYDANHRILTTVNELGQTTLTNTYDSYGRITSQQDGVSTGASSFVYYKEIDGSYTTLYLDRNSQPRYYTYDTQWRLIRYKDELGKVTHYTYDAAGNRTTRTDPLNRVTQYGYDARGNLTRVTDPAGSVTSMTYNSVDRLTSLTNPLNQTATYQYGAGGTLLQKLIDPLNNETQYAFGSVYQSATNLTQSITLPRGGVMQMSRNPQNTAGSLTDATGRVINWQYNPVTRIRTEAYAVAPSETTVTTYDPYGRLLTRTNPLGQTTTYSYDNRGRTSAVTDARGGVTTLTYNLTDRIASRTNALNQTTSYTYDAEERLKTVTDPLGRVITLTYDEKGQATNVSAGSLQTMALTYTDTGAVASRTSGSTSVTYGYDARDRRTLTTNELGHTVGTTYDAAGRPSILTDALGRKTTLGYDATGRLTSIADPLNGSASQSFDADGNQTGITDPKNQSTTFSYDLMGRLTGSTTPDGSTVTLTHDGKGLPATFINGRNQSTTYTYNAAGRLTQLVDPAGSVSFTYDVNGNRLTASDGVGTITRTYDALNRISSHTDVYGNQIQYEYDAAGNLTQLTYPGGKVVGYTYDAANRLKTVTDWANRVTTYTYDTAGRVTAIRNSNNKNASFTYDAAGQLTTLANGINSVTYTLDASGSVVQESVTNLARPALAPTFTYDGANRLATVNAQTINHDADGNMLNVWNGTLLQLATYDARNRLTALDSASYIYDADNQRVAQTVAGTTTRYVVNPNTTLTQVLMETDASGTPTAFYVYGIGLIGREDTAGAYVTYHYDHRGSTVALSNTAGVATDTYKYGPYGEMVSRTGTNTQPFQYNGRDGVMSDASGLYYLRARYYSPDLKRFVQRDVLAGTAPVTPSLNRYAYVNGQPIDLIDPFGLAGQPSVRAISTDFFVRVGSEFTESFAEAYVDVERGNYADGAVNVGLGVLGLVAAIDPLSFALGNVKVAAATAADPLAALGYGSCKTNRQVADGIGLIADVVSIRNAVRGLKALKRVPAIQRGALANAYDSAGLYGEVPSIASQLLQRARYAGKLAWDARGLAKDTAELGQAADEFAKSLNPPKNKYAETRRMP